MRLRIIFKANVIYESTIGLCLVIHRLGSHIICPDPHSNLHTCLIHALCVLCDRFLSGILSCNFQLRCIECISLGPALCRHQKILVTGRFCNCFHINLVFVTESFSHGKIGICRLFRIASRRLFHIGLPEIFCLLPDLLCFPRKKR